MLKKYSTSLDTKRLSITLPLLCKAICITTKAWQPKCKTHSQLKDGFGISSRVGVDLYKFEFVDWTVEHSELYFPTERFISNTSKQILISKTMAPKYKLTYFNVKALAEPIRMLFHYAKVEFEDVRVEREDWPNLKSQMPWNVMPVLEEDGKVLAQSLTILQYLGRKFGVASKDEWSIAKGNEYIDAVNDARQEVTKAFREEDETKKAEIKKNLKEVVLPRLLKKLDDILKQNGTGVLVGKDVTYADIYVSFMTEFLTKFVEFDVNEYSNVVGLHKKINNSPGIKEWIQVRPDTQF